MKRRSKRGNKKDGSLICIDKILDDFLCRYVHNQVKEYEEREGRKLTDSEIFYFDEGVKEARKILVPLINAYDKYFYEEVLK